MKNTIFVLVLLIFSGRAMAQKNREFSIAVLNTGTAFPFAKFGNLFTGIQQPGVEAAYRFNWKTKSKHDWFQEIKAGYFYHRFVQDAFPIYTNFGYRYKFSPHWSTQIAAGGGYLHSIPATAKFKLGDDGEYKNDKGVGRAQAMAVFNVGGAYILHGPAKKAIKIFSTYQMILQTPFVKSYVPVLPYNSLLIGCGIPLQTPKK